MSFKVDYWSFSKRPNSTKRPSTTAHSSFDCTLKGPCSIMAPVFEVNYGNAGTDPIGYNYCYVPAFDRYYWVSDWVNDGPIWECRLSEDELATWKTAIGSSTQYILRSSHTGDGDIRDELYPTKAGTVTAATVANLYTSSLASGYYVVGIINKDAASTAGNMGCVKYYSFTADGLRSFMTKLFTDNFTGFSNNDSNLTESVYKSLFNPIEYITSCIFLPVQPVTGNAVTSLTYGYWALSGITGCEEVVLSTNRAISGNVGIPKHPQAATRGGYLNLAPFSRYHVIIPPFGQIPLDPSMINAVNNLYYRIIIDSVTGQAILKLTLDSSYQVIIYEATAQIGVPIALAQMSRDYMGALTSAVGGAAGALTSGLMGNPIGAIAGGISAIGSTAQALMPQLSTNGANGSFISLTQDLTMVGQFLPLVDEDNANLGRPLCTPGTVSSYPGYLVIRDPDLQALEANRTELETIRQYMTQGFFYE